MSNMILEKYYLGAIILVLILLIISFISAVYALIDAKNRNKSIKKYFKVEISLVMLIISVASIWYQGAKKELIENFNNNHNILCRHKQEFIIINKDANYVLKDGYFIKGNVAIDMDVCKRYSNKEVKEVILNVKNTGDYVLKADELKALQKIAKAKNKTVQEIFVELIKEFIDKNIKKIKENEI